MTGWKTAAAGAALLALASCATPDDTLKGTLGTHVSGAVAANGAPTQAFDMPGGGKAYTWIQRRNGAECWITLTTDAAGVVQGYSYRGCP